ncbi:SpoIIE family protein phosphatase [Stieleria sp. ICT_E10.1]|uniref:SpoIIE family protein phosphatase n=1 Tax=Stieleria sedimenti TaxID=2976331 RepID=UPI0021802AC9|nr:SpoIIE family protein phosphatase [Stieleria sedimenti]MCS7466396.1 SpoIIE family protein phosphatase [Stieleria sedimenti]
MKSPKIWRQLPLSRQLLIAVNSVLLVVVTLFVVIDHRLRIVRHVDQARVALSEEAKTLYEAAVALDGSETRAVQKLVDDVCARMNTMDSPGHHIALQWQGELLQANLHGRASPEMIDAMIASAKDVAMRQPMKQSIVVGSFAGPAGAVYVSEKRSNLISSAREELLRQLSAVVIAGAVATAVVNLMLYLVVTKPMRKLVASLKSVGEGNLDSRTQNLSCRELRYLGDQINVMAERLESSDRDRRLHMAKAREIQQNLRPDVIQIPQLRIDSSFEPADDVGGDYYDVIALNDSQVLICLADVAGHGVPAAMAATLLKAFVCEAAKVTIEPSEILCRVNRQYCEYVVSGHFATMVLVRIDLVERRVVYANAGHEWPFVHRGGLPVERLEAGDLLLGVEVDTEYEQAAIPIRPGMKIVLVSDGVTEAFNPSEEQFGTQRVEQVIASGMNDHANELTKRFEDSLNDFRSGRAAFDDTTLLVVEIL